jgi:hypothetical protein
VDEFVADMTAENANTAANIGHEICYGKFTDIAFYCMLFLYC